MPIVEVVPTTAQQERSQRTVRFAAVIFAILVFAGALALLVHRGDRSEAIQLGLGGPVFFALLVYDARRRRTRNRQSAPVGSLMGGSATVAVSDIRKSARYASTPEHWRGSFWNSGRLSGALVITAAAMTFTPERFFRYRAEPIVVAWNDLNKISIRHVAGSRNTASIELKFIDGTTLTMSAAPEDQLVSALRRLNE